MYQLAVFAINNRTFSYHCIKIKDVDIYVGKKSRSICSIK